MAEILVPLWEPVIMGNPFYIWLILLLVAVIGIGLAAFKIEIYDRLEPVWGHRNASFSNTPEAILCGMSGKMWLMSVNSIAGIFEAMGLPLKWLQTAPTQGQLGKVNTIILSDDWNIVHNVDLDYAIVHAVHTWNENWTKGHTEGDDGFIYDWDSFEYHLMNGDLDALFPTGIRLPPVRNVNLHEIRKYLPKWTASHHSGYINAELEKRKDGEDPMKYKGFVMIALLAGAIILGSSVLGYVILMAAK